MQIKCHAVGRAYEAPHFFVLNKGLNSGKPLVEPCPNCFVIVCSNALERERLYWLSFALWQSRAVYPFLRGSVIEFVSKSDFSGLLIEADRRLASDAVEQVVKSLLTLSQLEENLKKQIEFTKQAKQVLCRRHFN